MTTPPSLLIVYHTLTGGSLQMAEAAAAGASSVEPGMRVLLRHADAAGADDLMACQGYLFVTPENLGALSGVIKHFFDRTYYAVLDRIVARPYGSMICAGSDGTNAARQIDRIATGWRLKAIAPPVIICTQAQTPEDILRPKVILRDDLRRCEELAATLASGLALGIF